jgi:hypothetical protein
VALLLKYEGVNPVILLKFELNAESDKNPTEVAIPSILK